MTIIVILQMPWIKPSALSDTELTFWTMNTFRHLDSLTDRWINRKTRIYIGQGTINVNTHPYLHAELNPPSHLAIQRQTDAS
jgi:hypothetical protein